MSNRKYPRYRIKDERLPKGKQCRTCKTVIPKGNLITVETVEYNWFRGDDGVFYHCVEHGIKDQRLKEGASVAH